jgi:hypothetical protein
MSRRWAVWARYRVSRGLLSEAVRAPQRGAALEKRPCGPDRVLLERGAKEIFAHSKECRPVSARRREPPLPDGALEALPGGRELHSELSGAPEPSFSEPRSELPTPSPSELAPALRLPDGADARVGEAAKRPGMPAGVRERPELQTGV